MTVTKAIGLFLLLAGSSGFGCAMSRQVTQRYEELRELQRMVSMLCGEIQYRKTPLPEAFDRIGKRLKGTPARFLQELSQTLYQMPGESLAVLFQEEIGRSFRDSDLSKKDLEHLACMGESLGYLDGEMQLRTLKLYQIELEEEITDTRKNMPGKKKLYQSLGMIGGVFLVILLW